MSLSLLIINYRTAELAAAAVASARKATHREIQVVVVDNSCDEAESKRLRAIPDAEVIVSSSNLGYAGGINLGLESCSQDRVVVSNPDVVFEDGSIDALLRELDHEKVVLSGPAFFWDDDLTWHLPPAETMKFGEQLFRNLSCWTNVAARRLAATRFERRLQFWRLERPTDVAVLSGAVMAFRTDDLRRLRLDERYRLYFEEVDLMRRIRKEGGTIRYVPSAHVRHLWARSAGANSEAQELFEESRRRFRRKWFGRPGDAVLSWSSTKGGRECELPALENREVNLPDTGGKYLVELGDGPEFLMAAGRFSSAGHTVALPLDLMEHSPLGRYCVRVTDLDSRSVIERWSVSVGRANEITELE